MYKNGVSIIKPILIFPFSILLDSWHPFSPNQRSCSPSPLASSTSSLVILASSCPSLQTPTLISEQAHHPSSTYARTISLHSPLPSELLFPSILTSPSVLQHTVLSPLLSQSFLKLSSRFPSNTMSHSHITLLILHNSDRPFLSGSTLPILPNSDRPFLSASARTWISHFGIPWTSTTKEE